jgi:hypothetical protein
VCGSTAVPVFTDVTYTEVIHILVGTKFKSMGWTIRVSILGRVKIFFLGFLLLAEAPDTH